MSFSLEDRVRLLTDQAIAAEAQREVDASLLELNAAITDHVKRVESLAK